MFVSMHAYQRLGLVCLLACGAAGCGSAGLFLKSPVEDQCKSTGLHGCPELTEGTLAFVDGDRTKGAKMLAKGAALNSPKELKQFAEAISALGSLPGVSQYMGPVLEVAAILKGEKPVPGVEVDAGSASSPAGTGANDATDAKHTSGMLYPARSDRRFSCAGDEASACVRSKNGPFLITDVSVTRECGDGAVMFSAATDLPTLSGARWIVSGPISNGRWLVPDGDMLVVAVLGKAGESIEPRRGCAISWSSSSP